MDKSTPGNIYGTTEDRINTLGNVRDHKAVHRVYRAVREEIAGNTVDDTIKLMRDKYGIALRYINEQDVHGWAMDFDVVDEKLYTLFLLKYN